MTNGKTTFISHLTSFQIFHTGQQVNNVLFAVCGDPVEQDVEEVHLSNPLKNCSKPADYPHNVNGPTGANIDGLSQVSRSKIEIFRNLAWLQ